MENKEISNYPDLVLHIMHLKQEKFRQEEEIKHSVRELIFLLNPLTMIKRAIHDMAADSEAKFDMAKVGLDMGITMIVQRILQNVRGIKGFFGKLLLKKVSSSFIFNNVSKVVSAFRNRTRSTPYEINQQS
jgi:hypothetical protein